MVNEIINTVTKKINELYPNCKCYTDDIPQKFTPPAFVVFTIDQDYSKRLNNKYRSRISFDLAYFSDKPKQEIKSDYLAVQEKLLRNFDVFGTFKATNKNARITDNVLHLTFDVNYAEMRTETPVLMQTQTTNTNI